MNIINTILSLAIMIINNTIYIIVDQKLDTTDKVQLEVKYRLPPTGPSPRARTKVIQVAITIIIIIITKPKPAYGRQGLAGLWGQDTDQAGTFWGVLNVSLCGSGAQLIFKLI